MVKQRLVGKGGKPRKYDIDNETSMAVILKLVGDVASEGPQSHLLSVPAAYEHYIGALEENPNLMKLVGDSYKNNSYKGVHCLGMSFGTPIPMNFSIISTFSEFFRKKPAATQNCKRLI
jgi:hypothetical protein